MKYRKMTERMMEALSGFENVPACQVFRATDQFSVEGVKVATLRGRGEVQRIGKGVGASLDATPLMTAKFR